MGKILIVSETNVITKSVKSFLEDAKFDVCHISSGAEAMTKLFTEKFDVLITSLFNPDIDGVQLISTLKKSQTLNSSTATILLTSGENVSKLFSEELVPDFIVKKDESTLIEISKAVNTLRFDISKKKVRLLYIDDDKFVQKMISMWLSKISYIELDLCGSINELQQKLNNEYDIIVSDNLLGDGQFSDVVDYVQNSNLKDTPIMIYTGTVDKLNVDHVKSLGNILDVLPKPFEMKSFLKKIEFLRK